MAFDHARFIVNSQLAQSTTNDPGLTEGRQRTDKKEKAVDSAASRAAETTELPKQVQKLEHEIAELKASKEIVSSSDALVTLPQSDEILARLQEIRQQLASRPAVVLDSGDGSKGTNQCRTSLKALKELFYDKIKTDIDPSHIPHLKEEFYTLYVQLSLMPHIKLVRDTANNTYNRWHGEKGTAPQTLRKGYDPFMKAENALLGSLESALDNILKACDAHVRTPGVKVSIIKDMHKIYKAMEGILDASHYNDIKSFCDSCSGTIDDESVSPPDYFTFITMCTTLQLEAAGALSNYHYKTEVE